MSVCNAIRELAKLSSEARGGEVLGKYLKYFRHYFEIFLPAFTTIREMGRLLFQYLSLRKRYDILGTTVIFLQSSTMIYVQGLSSNH